MEIKPKFSNRLVDATSPYLLQHAHNPVGWQPWDEVALRRAREEDKPIFLSIGYAACHWCHVMERESFENLEIADVLNRDFICIKVDREERPDLDEIYMTATQLLTQSGGWPMTVFLTPDLKPFFAGTYFPPEDRWGRPGFKSLLEQIGNAWKQRRPELEEQGERLAAVVDQVIARGQGQAAVDRRLVQDAWKQLERGFDSTWGGFGGAPKFPPSMRLEALLQRYQEERDASLLRPVTTTLDYMARGGMYDQVGGGFHRYSVDERWLVPHFEKMLYDNAQLARVYALAFKETGNWYYERVARETYDYILREMTHADGGFYSTTDADSEGVEGKFFVWSPAEVQVVLGKEEASLFCRIYDIVEGGNFEGHSIPNLLRKSLDEWAADLGEDPPALDRRLAEMRRRLWERREQRVHPLLDDKILSAWNGLMIRAFAEGYRVFADFRYRQAAEQAAGFVLDRMRDDNRLYRSWREGRPTLNGYAEDYAAVALALLDLHGATDDARWCDRGIELLTVLDSRFWDEEEGGYFFTSHDHETLITRPKSFQDGATPSANSLAALALIRAARLTRDDRWLARASQLLTHAAPMVTEMAAGFPNMAVAAHEYLSAWPEGIRIPGADAVLIEGFLSQGVVVPGQSFAVAFRLEVREGHHISSHTPYAEHLAPTRLEITLPEGFRLVRLRYPPGRDHTLPFQDDPLSVYSGTVLVGADLEAAPDAEAGRYTLEAQLRLQPCDDQQCFPPMEARMRIPIAVGDAPGPPQHAEVFTALEEATR
jgi:uncharacterized protein